MESERDEMFRLTRIRMQNFKLVSQLAKETGGMGMATNQTGGKKGKKDKPNPNQPSDKPKEKKEKEVEVVEPDNTPLGEKKDCTKPMDNSYHPKKVEAAWYPWWEKQKFFHADADAAIKGQKTYTMVIPPPNVTGALHLGHALMLVIEDAIMRWRRMNGHVTLWLPGCDHAGIATQSVVEKQIWKKEKKTRHDYGREEFVKMVWNWKDEYGGRINTQFKRYGISVDWERFAFTLDETRSKAVTEAFVRMFEKKLIYRDTRLVNWSAALRTALSDLEVEYIDLDEPKRLSVPGHDPNKTYEFGYLTNFTYKVKGTEETIEVATTRLETMLGDVAVAVHPDDPRYKHLHGKELEHPFVKDRKMIVITDPVLVDMNYGTGAVKITPAHDPNDYQCGRRHKLPQINILDEDGKINSIGAQFAGMPRFDARIAVYKELEKMGMIKGKTKNKMRLGVCSKSNDIIEPFLKPQWYVDCKDMAKRSVDAVKNKDLTIIPASHEKTWFDWLENIQDWCISRQLWWGHRIPCYLVTIPGKIDNPDKNNHDHWVVGRTAEEAKQNAAKKFGVNKKKVKLQQDEDVLDTWFSSGLFPFSTMGWPDVDTKDMKAFFPGDLLETGYDILFFWVARMVMMSLELTDKLPFKTVFLHPMVRDKDGAKMSKSKGNVIDPLEVMDGCELDVLIKKLDESNLPQGEIKKAKVDKQKDFPKGIPECGTDALRFGLMSYMVQSSINLDVKRVVGYKQFGNKLWNISKFALMNFPEGFQPEKEGIKGLKLSLVDKWIINRLSEKITRTNQCFENYDFGTMVNGLYDFWLKELADFYIEAIKPVMKGNNKDAQKAALNTLYLCLDNGLKMLHPTMCYITEELYQRLPHRKGEASDSICIATFPTNLPAFDNQRIDENFNNLTEMVKQFRSMIAALDIKKDKNPSIFIKCTTDQTFKDFKGTEDVFQTLVKSGECKLLKGKDADPEGCLQVYINEDLKIFLKVIGIIEVKSVLDQMETKAKATQDRLDKAIQKTKIKDYEKKVAPDVQEQNKDKIKQLEIELAENVSGQEKLKKLL